MSSAVTFPEAARDEAMIVPRTRPKNPPVKGDAFAAGLQLSYPIVRGYKQSLYASGGLDMLNSDNAIYGQQLTSDRQRTLRAGLSYASAAARRSLSASVTGGLGLEGLGARVDERLSDPDFKKATFQGALNQAVGKRVALRLRVMASSVNPVDVKIRSGAVALAPAFPAVLHGDVAGVVDAVGSGVAEFRTGDRVFGLIGGVKGCPGALAEYACADAPNFLNMLVRRNFHSLSLFEFIFLFFLFK